MGLISRGLWSFVSTPRWGSDETRYLEVTKLPVGGSQGLLAGSSSSCRRGRSSARRRWSVAEASLCTVAPWGWCRYRRSGEHAPMGQGWLGPLLRTIFEAGWEARCLLGCTSTGSTCTTGPAHCVARALRVGAGWTCEDSHDASFRPIPPAFDRSARVANPRPGRWQITRRRCTIHGKRRPS